MNGDGFDDFLNVFGATVSPSSAGYNYLIFGNDDSPAAVSDWNLY